jgi:hypothetical protein
VACWSQSNSQWLATFTDAIVGVRSANGNVPMAVVQAKKHAFHRKNAEAEKCKKFDNKIIYE